MNIFAASPALLLILCTSCWLAPTGLALVPSSPRTNTNALTHHQAGTTTKADRRAVLQNIFGSAASLAFLASAFPTPASALDMDAFINSQIDADTKNCDPKRDPKCKPKLSQDEALCKYGQSGQARGEACLRVKAAGGELPKAGSAGKSLGGAYAM